MVITKVEILTVASNRAMMVIIKVTEVRRLLPKAMVRPAKPLFLPAGQSSGIRTPTAGQSCAAIMKFLVLTND